MSVLGGTSLSADGSAPIEPGREGKDPSSEVKTMSGSTLFMMVAVWALRR
jgi:hypothetical protein